MNGTVKKRSVIIAGHRTSVSLEAAFWDALKEIARTEGMSINQLITKIDAERTGNLSSAIRVHVLHRVRGGDAAKTRRGGASPPSTETARRDPSLRP